MTNAQKLAHPWKTHRQEKNRQNKQKLDRIIEAHVQYIHNPAATLTDTHCWNWQAPETPRSHTIPKPTLYLCMNRVSTSAPSTPNLSASPPPNDSYRSLRKGRRTSMLRATDYTTSLRPGLPPFPKIIPGTPDNSNSDTTETTPTTYNRSRKTFNT